MDQSGALDTLLQEDRVFRPLPGLVMEANVNPQELAAAYRQAAQDPLGFWESAALELEWFRRWDKVLDESAPPHFSWFPGARCNIAHNALDRHTKTGNKHRLALIWEGEPGDIRKFTYFELYRAVNKLAGALRSLGVAKGDRVVVYMPPLPETVISMLACAKIGAVHCVVFPGFTGKALKERLRDARAKCLITADGFYRNGRVVPLKASLDEVLAGDDLDAVDICVVVRRANLDVEMHAARDVWYDDIVRHEKPEAPTEVMSANDPLFLLYTSGAAGKPKGVVHSHGGYMVGVHHTLNWVFDIKPTDIFWCTADPGWITGHSYAVYAPLLAGTTTLLYEGHPLYPQADRMWHITAKHGVSALYTTPTTIRMLMRYGNQFPRQHDLTSLRMLGSVGEPINPEAWVWFYQTIGRGECPVMDTWWQTETGQIMIAPMPVSLIKPGSVNKPLPGIEADIVDRSGAPVPPGKGGLLVIRRPWPGMMHSVWNDEEAYLACWNRIPGCYLAGDVARRDEDGYFWMQGRADEVINIAGHRLGTAELESALVSHRAVAEAAVIGVPDKIKGELAKAFVILREGFEESDELARELREHMRRELGPVAELKGVKFRADLPKTKSGKIMRRLLKAEELGTEPGDVSMLDDE
ncbi:acetate/CoA ligase [Desulfovibrio sp. X2]|uniref:acetate--CoA ligase n=1 Tax=Desulfovibrio sp. X2 TaxID=941449 RepID=UPI000358ED19|nr:acetate--CoA ligase [Desulfovibrio sp. X2]EPR43354.1 acetate/CoA ligase [Desulfovibrio sp. X2]